MARSDLSVQRLRNRESITPYQVHQDLHRHQIPPARPGEGTHGRRRVHDKSRLTAEPVCDRLAGDTITHSPAAGEPAGSSCPKPGRVVLSLPSGGGSPT